MRTSSKALLLVAAAMLGTAAQASEVKRDIYYGVTLIDPESETRQPDSYITIEDGKIVEIGQGLPADVSNSTLHDHSGQFALPGLIDTHAHLTWGPLNFEVNDGVPKMIIEDRSDITAFNARQLLSFGVTTVRSPAGDTAANRAYSQMRADGELIGPEAFHAGEVIDQNPIEVDGPIMKPGPDLSISDIVQRQSDAGAVFIKLYTGLSEQELAEGIEAAHAQGLETIAHLGDVSWTTAAKLGIDALVHMMPVSPDLLPVEAREEFLATRRPGSFEFFEWYEVADFDAPPMQEMIETLAERRVYTEATLGAFKPAFFGDKPDVIDIGMQYAHPDSLENWRTLFRFDLGWQASDYERAQAVWPKLLELTKRMYEAGVPMTIGTDLANPYVAPGIGMSQEMTLHREAGIPAWAVLRMATIEGARLLRIDSRTGRIAAGYEADILFVGADPVHDFANLRQVRAVLSDGTLFNPNKIRQTNGDMK